MKSNARMRYKWATADSARKAIRSGKSITTATIDAAYVNASTQYKRMALFEMIRQSIEEHIGLTDIGFELLQFNSKRAIQKTTRVAWRKHMKDYFTVPCDCYKCAV